MTTVLLDCDGCLTDDRQYIDHTGKKMFMAFNSKDIRATKELIANGYRVIIVTANESDIVKRWADKVGAEYHLSRDKGDLPYVNYVAVGNDAWDVGMLEKANKAFCPADADYSVRMLPNIKILETKGGYGVVAELVRHIL
jgi:3-deoxy-D-manno-octulosonate 8-phosphate phosphatase KdsC-like HAD superfamily phosphatase